MCLGRFWKAWLSANLTFSLYEISSIAPQAKIRNISGLQAEERYPDPVREEPELYDDGAAAEGEGS